MKRKLWIMLLTLIMVFSFAAPAMAYEDYGLIYDDTGQLDGGNMGSLSDYFSEITDEYGVEVRCDILTDTEGYSLAEYADIFWDKYEYGYGDNRNGVFLIVQVHSDETGIAFDNYYIKLNGVAATIFGEENIGNALHTAVGANFNADSWSGDLEQDKSACNAGLSVYAETLKQYFIVEGCSGSAVATSDTGEDNGYVVTGFNQAAIDYVTDSGGYISSDDLANLNVLAAQVSEKYGCGVYAMIVEDYTQYNSQSVYEAAKTIYLDNTLGWGDDFDGVFLLLSMSDRDYSLIAYGDFGNAAFTDHGKDVLADRFLSKFGDDDWYGGFKAYISGCDEFLAAARSGQPVDVSSGAVSESPLLRIAIVVLVPLILALIICMVFRAQMKSVKKGAEADAYVVGSVNFTHRNDYFTYSTEVRRVIEKNKGGSGTSVDSDGFSGKSGKF